MADISFTEQRVIVREYKKSLLQNAPIGPHSLKADVHDIHWTLAGGVGEGRCTMVTGPGGGRWREGGGDDDGDGGGGDPSLFS